MRDLTSKKTVLALAIAGAILAMVASGRPWVVGTLNDGVVSSSNVKVSGSQAVPGYLGIALVCAAGLLAAATAGRIVRWPAAVLSLISSVALVGLTIKVMLDPADAVKSRMTAVAGHNGEAVAHGSFDAWFWVAVFASLLSVFTSVLGLLGVRRWAGLSSRYDAPATAEKRATSDWDLMSQGIDPTVEEPQQDAKSVQSAAGASRADEA